MTSEAGIEEAIGSPSETGRTSRRIQHPLYREKRIWSRTATHLVPKLVPISVFPTEELQPLYHLYQRPKPQADIGLA